MLRSFVIGFGPLILAMLFGMLAPRIFPQVNRVLSLIAGTLLGLLVGGMLAYPLSDYWPK